MTSLILTNPQTIKPTEKRSQDIFTPFRNIVHSRAPVQSTVREKEPGFIDAWVMSNNGQG